MQPELVGRPVNAHNEVSTRTFFARFAVAFALIAARAAAFAFALALAIEFAFALAFTRQHCDMCERHPPISTSIEYLSQSGRVDSSAPTNWCVRNWPNLNRQGIHHLNVLLEIRCVFGHYFPSDERIDLR